MQLGINSAKKTIANAHRQHHGDAVMKTITLFGELPDVNARFP